MSLSHDNGILPRKGSSEPEWYRLLEKIRFPPPQWHGPSPALELSVVRACGWCHWLSEGQLQPAAGHSRNASSNWKLHFQMFPTAFMHGERCFCCGTFQVADLSRAPGMSGRAFCHGTGLPVGGMLWTFPRGLKLHVSGVPFAESFRAHGLHGQAIIFKALFCYSIYKIFSSYLPISAA